MPLPWDDIQANAIAFSKRWKDARNEDAEGQSFVTEFMRVFGVDVPVKIGEFEFKVPFEFNQGRNTVKKLLYRVASIIFVLGENTMRESLQLNTKCLI